MKVLSRLFPCKEVRGSLAALDQLRPIFEQSIGPSLAFDNISRRVKHLLIENPAWVKAQLEENGHQPRNVCLMAIVSITVDDLVSGQDHVYRGLLNMTGKGKKAAYRIAMAELEKAGVCTPEVRRLRAQELDEAIREVG